MSPRKPLTWSDSGRLTRCHLASCLKLMSFSSAISEAMECLAAHAGYTRTHNRVIGEKLLVKLPSAKPVLRNHRVDYAIIGSIADRGTSTCNAPDEAGNTTPWSKKKITPSLTTAKF